jgi:hypothetical protein
MSDLDTRLNDADVQKVIARALELQANSAQALTVAQVREIASDLAIPESAVDQALAEHRAAAVPAPTGTDATAAPSFWARNRLARRLMIPLGVTGGALVLFIVASIILRLFP